ncbi:hypothetical protein ASPFODRAFT_131619 [Aspergillus luchuensis CBS 106.47]|uniref:Uncharacterized protein n=1 Tax=Aspergillus luchuensis (strain CBS 106.47) TaxID=1137211 RepID=A0A1M3TLQ5_ASPLC|nr:hypothetical protein ASPFODRAFT_131619 [Aspergillus luchuensis CBS 106.47]
MSTEVRLPHPATDDCNVMAVEGGAGIGMRSPQGRSIRSPAWEWGHLQHQRINGDPPCGKSPLKGWLGKAAGVTDGADGAGGWRFGSVGVSIQCQFAKSGCPFFSLFCFRFFFIFICFFSFSLFLTPLSFHSVLAVSFFVSEEDRPAVMEASGSSVISQELSWIKSTFASDGGERWKWRWRNSDTATWNWCACQTVVKQSKQDDAGEKLDGLEDNQIHLRMCHIGGGPIARPGRALWIANWSQITAAHRMRTPNRQRKAKMAPGLKQ